MDIKMKEFKYIVKNEMQYIMWNKDENIFIIGTWCGGINNWHWKIEIVK